MENYQSIVSLILRAVALAMSVATVVLATLGQLSADTGITLLGIGLFTLALDALQSRERQPLGETSQQEA